jgi:TonB family protein
MIMWRANKRLPGRCGIAVGVALVHYYVLMAMWNISASSDAPDLGAGESLIATFIPAAPQPPDSLPLPIVHFQTPEVDTSIATGLVFTDPDAGKVPGVVGPMSVPYPVATDEQSRGFYSKRAGLRPGDVRTVVLNVQVLADGSIGDVTVATTSGDADADQQAIDYIRTVTWMPGSINQQASDMRIRYVVTLNG